MADRPTCLIAPKQENYIVRDLYFYLFYICRSLSVNIWYICIILCISGQTYLVQVQPPISVVIYYTMYTCSRAAFHSHLYLSPFIYSVKDNSILYVKNRVELRFIILCFCIVLTASMWTDLMMILWCFVPTIGGISKYRSYMQKKRLCHGLGCSTIVVSVKSIFWLCLFKNGTDEGEEMKAPMYEAWALNVVVSPNQYHFSISQSREQLERMSPTLCMPCVIYGHRFIWMGAV